MEATNESSGSKTAIAASLELRLKKYIHHFRKDDRVGSIFGKTHPRGMLDARVRAFNTLLLPAELDGLGVPKNGADFSSTCSEVVDILFQESKEALGNWVKRHDEPIEFLEDHNDPRVIEISRLGQIKLSENLQEIGKKV